MALYIFTVLHVTGGICSSGRAPFTCVPSSGTLEGKQVKEVKVVFDPDRQTSFYTDKLLVKFNGKVRKLFP